MIDLIDVQRHFHKCSGVIISKWHILTAAHCLQNATYMNILILSGKSTTSSSVVADHLRPSQLEPSKDGTFRPLTKMEIHPEFNIATTANDIAILLVKKPFDFEKEGLQPASIFEAVDQIPKAGDICSVAG